MTIYNHPYRLLIVTVGLFVAACSANEPDNANDSALADILKPSDKVIVVAHRGCWKETSENSLAAVDRCIASGIDVVEIDVARSKDGHLIVMHDETIDRTTNGSGKVADLTLDELRPLKLRAGAGGDNANITAEVVPTWRDILKLAKGKILINLDAKDNVREQALAEAIELGVEDQIISKIAVSAPDDPSLTDVTFWKHGHFMPILSECTDYHKSNNRPCTPNIAEALSGYDHYSPFAYEVTYVSEEYLLNGLPEMRSKGRVWVNTMFPHHAGGILDKAALKAPDATWGHLIDMGVNMIQTDEPEALIDYLQVRNLRASASD